VKSVKSECLDHLTLSSVKQLEYVLEQYGMYFHHERTHQGVPPRKDAVLSDSPMRVLSQRNQHILKIEKTGRSDWCRRPGYYWQSHVENTFSRFKRIIGERLRSKHDEAQKREALIGCAILNRMLEIGRPVSCKVC